MSNGEGASQQTSNNSTTQQSKGLSYDPMQDLDDRRKLRREYRKLMRGTQDHREAMLESQDTRLADALEKADRLYAQVKNPTDAMLDSRFLKMTAELGIQRVKALQLDFSVFSREDFYNRLAAMGGNGTYAEGNTNNNTRPVNMKKLGKLALRYIARVPAVDFMLGPLGTEYKPRNMQRRIRDKKDTNPANLTLQPEEIDTRNMQKSERETSQNVIKVQRRLEQYGKNAVELYRFICNPESFGQTVENLFHLSFLLRDELAQFYVKDDDIWLKTCDADMDLDSAQPNNQQLPFLNYEVWKGSIRYYNIKSGESILPHRKEQSFTAGSKGWYA